MIVVDASVINKLFLPLEENCREAKKILQKHLEKLEEIVIPDLLLYEVANTLATKTDLPPGRVTKSLHKLGSLNLQVYHFSIEDTVAAAKFAKKYKVSVYDATYTVLAQEKKCDLVTADAKFANQVKLPFVKTLNQYPDVST